MGDGGGLRRCLSGYWGSWGGNWGYWDCLGGYRMYWDEYLDAVEEMVEVLGGPRMGTGSTGIALGA